MKSYNPWLHYLAALCTISLIIIMSMFLDWRFAGLLIMITLCTRGTVGSPQDFIKLSLLCLVSYTFTLTAFSSLAWKLEQGDMGIQFITYVCIITYVALMLLLTAIIIPKSDYK